MLVTVNLEIPPGKSETYIMGPRNYEITNAFGQLEQLEIIHRATATVIHRIGGKALSDDVTADDVNPCIGTRYHPLEMDRPAFRRKTF